MLYKMRLAGFLILTFMALTIPAEADEDVQTLLEKCSVTHDPISMNYCYGLIGGFFAMMSLNGDTLKQNFRPSKKLSICSDSVTTSGALAQIFINWANKHPEMWQTTSLIGVASALNETWPCPEFQTDTLPS